MLLSSPMITASGAPGFSLYGSAATLPPPYASAMQPGVLGLVFDEEKDANGLKRCVVKDIEEDSPASKEPNISIGDTIVTVASKNVYGLGVFSLKHYLSGPQNTQVKLGFQHNSGKRFEVTLTRAVDKTKGMGDLTSIYNTQNNSLYNTQNSLGPEKTEAQSTEKNKLANASAKNDAEEKVKLPPGWEKKLDPKGFVFWVNHEDKMISYSHPGLTSEDGGSSVAGTDSELDA